MSLNIVTPILAQNMMACTQPVSFFSEKRENPVLPFDSENPNLEISFPRVETVSIPLTQFIIDRYCEFPCERYPISPPKTVHHSKIGSMNRRHHNIHQPGRTNCTQRFQKM